LAQLFDVHPNQITIWRGLLLEAAAGGVRTGWSCEAGNRREDVCHAKSGELTLVNDFLSGALGPDL
jgi:transposase